MARKGYVCEISKTVFFWSQKAACTSLFQALYRTYGGEARKYHDESKPWQECLPLLKDGYRSVAVSRHPESRITSCFFNKFVVYYGNKIQQRENMEGFSRNLFDKHIDIHGGHAERNDITFEQFLDVIEKMHAARKKPGDNKIDGHWDTQCPPEMRDFKYDILARVEDFPESMENLCRRVGLIYNNEKLNSTKVATSTVGYLGNVPARVLSAIPCQHDDLLSNLSIEKIHKIYADDYMAFGYD
jgi:hypothetical protein